MNQRESTDLPDNPFVGLRPFEVEESLLFFGRRSETMALMQLLYDHRIVAVVGHSGSGKSSLVQTGLIPKLKAGFLVQDRDQWHVASMRPGHAPLHNLARAILEMKRDTEPPDVEALREAMLTANTQAMLNVLAPLLEETNINLLLLVDQFEELFRFDDSSSEESDDNKEKGAFIAILIELAQQRVLPVYVVLTMRSEFLGNCAKFDGLVESLNRSLFLVPRIRDKAFRAMIEGPIRLAGMAISEELVSRLLEDAGNDPDQLPIIQHALNRTWTCWQENGEKSEPLSESHYLAIGGIHGALNRAADAAYDELDNRLQHICKLMFKALTDKVTDTRGIRRPTTFTTLCELTGAQPAEMVKVIDIFRKPNRSLLMPPAWTVLEAETVIDISHECLMRVWLQLVKWTEEEVASVKKYQRLAETAQLHYQGMAGLWRGPDLATALTWRDKHHPTAQWASRYDRGQFDFQQAMRFLDASNKASVERLRWAMVVSSVSMIIIWIVFR